MPSTYDSLLRLELQAIGENSSTWGVKTNTNFELLARAIAGHESISIAGSGDYTLSAANATDDQAREAFITLTGTLTGARAIIIPSNSKSYYFRNNTSGSYAVTVKTTGGAAVTLPAAATTTVACDGTDCFIPNALPTGIIMLWSGSIASIPSGYYLCDGSNGTPDLRNRFIVGAGSTYSVAGTGGATSVTSGSGGSHSHGGTTGSHTLLTSEMPAHSHAVTDPTHSHALSPVVANHSGGSSTYSGPGAGALGFNSGTSAASTGITIDSTGGGGAHSHTISTEAAHTHTVATLPPYYALAYIMKS